MKQPLFTRAFVLAACATLMLSLAGFLFVHLPGFLQQLGAGETEIGRIMAVQALGAVIAWPLVGRVMDARGRRVVILGGCVLFIVTITLYLFIDSLGPFVYLVRLLDGVAHTMWYTALFTYGADLVPAQRRTHGLAIFGTAGLITIGLGAQFGDVILAYANYRELFFGALGFAVIGLLMCLPLRDVLVTDGDASLPSRGIFAAATQWNLLPIWCASVAFFVSLQGLFAFLKTFISTVNIGSVGSFCIAYATIAVALRVFLGWIPDRLGTRRMLGIAMSFYALGFTVLSAAQTPVHVLVAGLLCGTGHLPRALQSGRGTRRAPRARLRYGLLYDDRLARPAYRWTGLRLRDRTRGIRRYLRQSRAAASQRPRFVLWHRSPQAVATALTKNSGAPTGRADPEAGR